MNYMQDKQFLLKLDQQKNRIVYVRLIALDKDEFPIESIEGRATGGSISIDGNSSVTRTCSLSLVGQDLHIHDYLWAMKNKFKVEIGLENHIDDRYDDIVWFKQGIFYITSFSLSESTNNFSISISGKDKMSKLDGSLGGTLTTQVDFGTYDEIQADGSIVNIKNPIRNIITQAVCQYAQEPVGKIIINDLPDYGFELWNYRGIGENDEPLNLYYFYQVNCSAGIYTTTLRFMALNTNYSEALKEFRQNDSYESGFESTGETKTLELIDEKDLYYPSLPLNSQSPKAYETLAHKYFISKIEYGQNAGYHCTDLVYPGELIANAGETIAAAVLTKIAQVLGDFEFFYDLDGNFVFQKKKTYITGLFSPITENQVMDFVTASQYSYEFKDAELITAYSNQPQISEVKNDFTIWGTRKSVNGNELPIHSRYAIAHKPEKYTCMNHFSFCPFVYVKNLGATYEDGAIKVANIGPYSYTDKNNELIMDNYVRFVKAENQDNAGIYIKTSYYKLDDKYIPYYIEDDLYIPLCSVLNTKYMDKDLYIKENNRFVKSDFRIEKNSNGTAINSEIFPRDLVNSATYYYIDRESDEYTTTNYDWRELIYLMAEDYYQHHQEADFSIKLRELNPDYVTGMTGYEAYYTDMMGFWRQLYDPYAITREEYEKATSITSLKNVSTISTDSTILDDIKPKQLYLNGIRAYTYDDIAYGDYTAEKGFTTAQMNAFRESLYKKCWSPTEVDDDGKIIKKGFWYLTSIAGQMGFGTKRDETTGALVSTGLYDLTDLTFDIRSRGSGMPFQENNRKIEQTKYHTINEDNKNDLVLYQINLTEAPWSLENYLAKEAICYRGYYTTKKEIKDESGNIIETEYWYDEKEELDGDYDDYYLEQTSKVFKGPSGSEEETDSLTSSFYALQEDFTYIVRTYETDADGNTVPVDTKYSIMPVKEKAEEFISDENSPYIHWSKTAVYYPEDLVFWLDFLDTQGDLEKFSIENIGNRNKVDNNNQVTALFYRETPMAEFVITGEQSAAEKSTNQSTVFDYIRLQISPDNEELFTLSNQGLSAAQRADELIYQNACVGESISITCIPIYYLQPNTRIYVYSENSKINGDYIVSKITLPLTYNGTMSISATKVVNLLK